MGCTIESMLDNKMIDICSDSGWFRGGANARWEVCGRHGQKIATRNR